MLFECVRKKINGKPCEGEPHARFEVAANGIGNTALLFDSTRVLVSSAKHIAKSKGVLGDGEYEGSWRQCCKLTRMLKADEK